MALQDETRVSAWESIRKLFDATRDKQVLTGEEVLQLGAYFAHGSKDMVTLPFDLVRSYDKWLHLWAQDMEVYIYHNAKLEEYLTPEQERRMDNERDK